MIDPNGEQVADLLAFSAADREEVISSGRTLDYASRIYLTTGDPIYSNRSNVLLRIVEDTVGRHDFLLTPCSADTFRIIYGDTHPHRGCFGNLAAALAPYGIEPDRIPVAFNVFMNVVVNGETGELKVEPPLRPGRRPCDLRGRDRPHHRAHRLLGSAIEQQCFQADPLRDPARRCAPAIALTLRLVLGAPLPRT